MKNALFKMMLVTIFAVVFTGCNMSASGQTNASGIKEVRAEVKATSSGMSVEQENIKNRVELENQPGSIKHLYVISPYSGQVIIYSTVKGKVTSSGKRLVPKYTTANNGETRAVDDAFKVTINGYERWTNEAMNETGTYGSSDPYIYWWDVNGRYHQHFVSGGQIIHVSDQPIPVKSVTINMELMK